MSSKEIIITDSNFEQEVLKSEKPVLVDFWASWCAPCKMVAPTIEQTFSNGYSFLLTGSLYDPSDNRKLTYISLSP